MFAHVETVCAINERCKVVCMYWRLLLPLHAIGTQPSTVGSADFLVSYGDRHHSLLICSLRGISYRVCCCLDRKFSTSGPTGWRQVEKSRNELLLCIANVCPCSRRSVSAHAADVDTAGLFVIEAWRFKDRSSWGPYVVLFQTLSDASLACSGGLRLPLGPLLGPAYIAANPAFFVLLLLWCITGCAVSVYCVALRIVYVVRKAGQLAGWLAAQLF